MGQSPAEKEKSRPIKNLRYLTWRRTDSDLVRAMAKVANDIGRSQLHITPLPGAKARIVEVTEIEGDKWLEQLFKENQRVLHSISIPGGASSVSVSTEEEESLDRVNVGFPLSHSRGASLFAV